MKLKAPIKIYIRNSKNGEDVCDVLTINEDMDSRKVDAELIKYIKANYTFAKGTVINKRFLLRNCTILSVAGAVDHMVAEQKTKEVTQHDIDTWLNRLEADEDEGLGDSSSETGDSPTTGE